MIRYISSKSVHATPGYSSAVAVSSDMLLISGQVAVDTDGAIVGKGDFDRQVEQIMKNLGALLDAADATFKDVARVGVILSDRKYLRRWRELRSHYFAEPFPASTLIIAGLISEDLLIEVEATACVAAAR